MAKSIRSKHRRKMRNVKREHYAKKDLEKLKRLAESTELENVVTMKSVEELKESSKAAASADDASMDIDEAKKNYNKRTMKDEHGNYPKWMNQRAVKKQKVKNAKSKIGKKATKKIKW